ncbi:MAG: rubrerythrin family protein [Methanotrichaceae archaeon]|nr:rubrerythrin family protein [Methanotrichaceae archaeon]
MTKTEDFLMEAFAGESQANRKYTVFAAQADKEGFAQAARLFRAAAEAEAVHAANHLRALKAIKSTKENLREAIVGETHEFKEMYPEMIEAARAEGARDAERSLSYANSVEEHHARLYHDMLDGLGAKKESYPYFVCPVCGMTVEKEAPDKCPVCGVKGSLFKKVE